MLSAKGLYEWKLIDANTNKIVLQDKKWNLVTDRFISYLSMDGTHLDDTTLGIVLSNSTPSPSIAAFDYRESGISHNKFNLITSGSFQNNNTTLNSKWTDYNFSPPSSARTITIIGIAITNTSSPNCFASFIELTSPITQYGTDSLTPQYLYVKYTIYFSYANPSGYTPDNRFLSYHINANLLSGFPLYFGSSGSVSKSVTLFNEPVTLNNVMRAVATRSTSTSIASAIGARLARRIEASYAVGDIPGPIGSVCQIASTMTLGYSPVNNLQPSVSRIFVHPESRLSPSIIFSDPSYPPSSNGSISISGTSESLMPIIGRIKIEKTGDASDIVDEVVAAADVNVGTNELTVVQTWATNDILQIQNDVDDPPNPLLEATNYYVIYVDSNHIKLSLTLNGPEINILDQGTGNNTLTRQNTAKYSLELQSFTETIDWYNSPKTAQVPQLAMAIDKDNKVQPLNLMSGTDYGEGGISWNSDPSYLVRGIFHVDDLGAADNYIYSIQMSRVSLGLTICRWKFWTIETSVALCKFGTSSTNFRAVFRNGTDAYIGTNEGIYKYDITTPTVAPSLLTITDIIDSNITDLVYDTVTGYAWSGHLTGLSKIDLGALTATKYIIGTGQQLQGMNSNDAIISTGQLSVYDGRILKVGLASMGGYNRPWVLQDGVGWYLIPTGNNHNRCGTVRKGTNQIVFAMADMPDAYIHLNIYRYSVTVTGLGTGSYTQLGNAEYIYTHHNYYNPLGVVDTYYGSQMVQIAGDRFCFDFPTNTPFNNMYEATYKIGSVSDSLYVACPVAFGNGSGSTNIGQYVTLSSSDAWRFSISRNLINCTNNTFKKITWYLLFLADYYPFKYGWNGMIWEKDNTTALNIKKTGSFALLDGLSVTFNNATGKPWDQQFVIGERFTFMYGPMNFKDNLQTMSMRARSYVSEVEYKTVSISVPVAAAYTYHVPEAVGVGVPPCNFREVDTYDLVTIVKEGSTTYTQYTLPTGNTFTTNYTTGILTVGTNIASGTVVHVSSTGTLPVPLRYKGVYYAINVSPTTIKLALTYADAMSAVSISLFDNGSGTHTIYQLAPTTTKYFLGMNGVFVFSSADAGKSLNLEYTSTYYS